MEIKINWNKKIYVIHAEEKDTFLTLKEKIFQQTEVLPERQKILGLFRIDKTNTKPLGNEELLSSFIFKKTPVMMIGTQEKFIQEISIVPDFQDEDDGEISDLPLVHTIRTNPENLQKIERRIKDKKIKEFYSPRPGKKLLVLDIDYTLYDHRSPAEHPRHLMRPYLHEFLSSCYHHYDIMIWSATSMKWIDLKMQELGVTDPTNSYKITAFIDYSSMITVDSEKYGVVNIKPLQVIWAQYPMYSRKNTIMFDDISRNFLMNPENGLKIAPFKNSAVLRYSDCELKDLTHYLFSICDHQDFSSLNHSKWRSYHK